MGGPEHLHRPAQRVHPGARPAGHPRCGRPALRARGDGQQVHAGGLPVPDEPAAVQSVREAVCFVPSAARVGPARGRALESHEVGQPHHAAAAPVSVHGSRGDREKHSCEGGSWSSLGDCQPHLPALLEWRTKDHGPRLQDAVLYTSFPGAPAA
eukprot:scaffold40637_cov66-Phaeocystis_antarctica.AAC.4